MIGFYRLGLAVSVVLFHFGDLSWISGRAALYGFYFLSGYLISRAIDVHYLQDPFGPVRYVANRVVRLAPLIVVFSSLGWLLTTVRGGGTFDFHGPERVFSDGNLLPQHGLGWFLYDLIARPEIIEPWVIHFSSHLNPPLWSIGVEFLFYALCPLLVVMARRGALAVHLIAALSIALSALVVYLYGHSDLDHNLAVYQNPLFSFSMFCVGVWFFFVTKDREPLTKRAETIYKMGSVLAFVLLGLYFYSKTSFDQWPSLGISDRHVRLEVYFYLTLPFIAGAGMIVVASGNFVNRGLAWVDRFCADISYGVYLSQFCAAFLVLWSLEWMGATAQLSRPQLGLAVVAASILLATAAYYAFEAPLDRLRNFLRMAVPVSGWRSANPVPRFEVLQDQPIPPHLPAIGAPQAASPETPAPDFQSLRSGPVRRLSSRRGD